MKTAESRRDVLPCLKTGLKFADLLRVYIDNNLLYKWICVCVALCTSACVCSCRCVFRMSSASESCRPASEQFNNTLLPCCTQLRTWEQIYSEVTWGTSFFTNIRLNTNIKLLKKKQRENVTLSTRCSHDDSSCCLWMVRRAWRAWWAWSSPLWVSFPSMHSCPATCLLIKKGKSCFLL